jgi:hypothetical protein
MAYDDILEELKSKGRYGDTELAHVTPGEAMLLKALGGSGTINPETGLKEYNRRTGRGAHLGEVFDNAIDFYLEEMNTTDISDWSDYTDTDPSDFSNLSDENLRTMSQSLTDMGISEDDFAKYMPKYDERGEFNIRQSRAFDRLSEARSGQAELIEVAQNKYGQQSRSGFASTGNPMIDKQRQDLMTDMSQSTSQAEWAMSQDIYDYQEEFQQKFGERLIAYEDRIEKKNASEEDDNTFITCVLSTAAYKQGLITDDELMSFVRWRMKTQKNHFLSEQKWLGYQIVWKPISKLMLKSKTFAKLINNTLLKGWKSWMAGNKAYLTRLILEGSSLIGYILRPKKAKELKQSLKALGTKGILKIYKKIIKNVENI